jgi:hypothetical protein
MIGDWERTQFGLPLRFDRSDESEPGQQKTTPTSGLEVSAFPASANTPMYSSHLFTSF